MNTPPVAIEQYEKLTPIAEKLYAHTDHLAQISLLPLFLLSIALAYSKDLGLQGALVSRVKRLVLTALILAAFPSLSGLIKTLGQEIALSIDNLQGLDDFLAAASKKADSYSASITSLLDFGNDIIVAVFVSASFLILYFARFCLVAFYHFYWMFLLVTAPFFILGFLFESTSTLTKNLFKNMMLVAAWPIVWSVLSAFLKGLPFADAYAVEGGYTTVIVMNLILAVSLLLSPFLLSHFCEGLVTGTGSTLYSAGRAAISTVAPKVGAVAGAVGKKAAPRLQKALPSRSRIKSATNRAGLNCLFFLFIGTSSFAETTQTINIHPGQSTLLCLPFNPDSAILGSAKYFELIQVGSHLALKSYQEYQKTNLLLIRGKDVTAYNLSSNTILPHQLKVNCNIKGTSKSKTSIRKKKRRFKPIATQNYTYATVFLDGVKWSSKKKDYLTIYLRVINTGTNALTPDWEKLTLAQTKQHAKHSKLWSERKIIPAGAESKAVIEFRAPNLSYSQKSVLYLSSNLGALNIYIPEVAL